MRLTRRHVLLGAAATGAAALAVPAYAAATANDQVRATIANSAYSWWGQPLAVNDGSHTWISGVGRQGTQRLWKLGPDAPDDPVELSRDVYPPDDHNTPAIAYHPEQSHLVVFYTGHGDDPMLRYVTVDRSTLELGEEQTLEFPRNITYAQVLRHNDRLVVFTRVGASQWWYRISDNFGDTWGPRRKLLDSGNGDQVYGLFKSVDGDSSQALFAFYGHPTMAGYRNVDIARIRMDSLDVEDFSGEVVGNLFDGNGPGFTPGDKLDAAIEPTGDHKVRLLDLGMVNGWPTICYAVWRGEEGPARYGVKFYRDGEFVSPQWSPEAGDPFGFNAATKYLGGVVIGEDDHLYSSRKAEDGTWYVEKWHWSEADDDFGDEEILAEDDEHPIVRPFAVLNDGDSRGDVEMVFQRVKRYEHFTDYDIDTLTV